MKRGKVRAESSPDMDRREKLRSASGGARCKIGDEDGNEEEEKEELITLFILYGALYFAIRSVWALINRPI